MTSANIPVDVLCVCSAAGQIRPLWLQMQAPEEGMQRIDIDQILSTKQICGTGAEAQVYRCRACVGDGVQVFDLKYLIRAHRWYLSPRNG